MTVDYTLDIWIYVRHVGHRELLFSNHNTITRKRFPHFWPIVGRIHRSTIISHDKGHWCWVLIFSCWLARKKNYWKDSPIAGDFAGLLPTHGPISAWRCSLLWLNVLFEGDWGWKYREPLHLSYHESLVNERYRHALLHLLDTNPLRHWGKSTLIARCMETSWGPSRADKTQVGPMLAQLTLPSWSDSNI